MIPGNIIIRDKRDKTPSRDSSGYLSSEWTIVNRVSILQPSYRTVLVTYPLSGRTIVNSVSILQPANRTRTVLVTCIMGGWTILNSVSILQPAYRT